MLIDTHAHVNFRAFEDDADEVIRRSLDQQIWLINVGSQKDTSRQSVELAEKYEQGVYASVGLHPLHLFSQHVDEEETSFLTREEEFDSDYYRQLAQSAKVVAIGEAGLDYFRLPKDQDQAQLKAKQKDIFKAQLALARELDLPLIIHCRDAYEDMAEILKQENFTRAVTHCFTGNWQQAKKFLDLGLYISFTGIITFGQKAGELIEVVKQTPLEQLMVETDAPYLSPAPHRGKRNEPTYVKFIADKVAEIKDISFNEVAETTFANAQQFFKLSPSRA